MCALLPGATLEYCAVAFLRGDASFLIAHELAADRCATVRILEQLRATARLSVRGTFVDSDTRSRAEEGSRGFCELA